MTARGGRRPGAGAKPFPVAVSRLQFRVNAAYLGRIDNARALIPSALDRPLSRAEFFRLAVADFLAALREGLPFPDPPPGVGAQHFPLELPVALRAEAERAVAAGLAPSLSELVREAGAWMARRVLAGERA